MTQKTYSAEFIEEAPALQDLYNRFGDKGGLEMLGLTCISKMLRDRKIRPAYEIAARSVLGPWPKTRSYIVKVEPENAPILLPLLDKLKIQFIELDF